MGLQTIRRTWTVGCYLGTFRFMRAWEVRPDEEAQVVDPLTARSALSAAAASRGAFALTDLGAALDRYQPAHYNVRTHQRELLQELVDAIDSKRLVAIQEPPPRPPVIIPREDAPLDLAATRAAEVIAAPGTFKLQVVLDGDGAPVGHLALGVKGPGERDVRDVMTDSSGRLVIEHAPRKPFEVCSTLRGVRLDACATVVGWGSSPVSPQRAAGHASDDEELPIRHLVEIEAYRVRDGDTPATVAARANMTWEDLAYFNWGTREPREVDRALTFGVGCRSRAPDGTATFTAKDAPGIIRLPRPVTKSGLAVDTEHVLRVQRATGFDQEFILFLHNGEPARDRRFSLHLEDGSEVKGTSDAEGRTGLKAADVRGTYRIRLLGPQPPTLPLP